jgi:hypothetical protein
MTSRIAVTFCFLGASNIGTARKLSLRSLLSNRKAGSTT